MKRVLSLARKFASRNAARIQAVTGAAVLAGGALVAQAQPPAADPIAFPIDTTSLVEEIATAGGVILLLIFGVWAGFKLVRKLMKRVVSSV
jgi:hypothetical protein